MSMSSMDKREKASETKFVLEANLRFKAEARRNKRLAAWVADLLGKSDEDAEKYVTEVIMSDMEEAGDDDVFRKVRKDFDEAGVEMSDIGLREKMDALMAEVVAELEAEG